MAQRRHMQGSGLGPASGGAQGQGALARRLGARTPRAPLVALGLLIVLVACVGATVLLGGRGVEIERDGGDGAVAASGTSAYDAASGQAAEDAEAPGGADAASSGAVGAAAGSGGDAAQQAATAVIVDVGGAVNSPGVYELTGADPRVRDAVEAAGGLAEGADTASINLAQKVADGSKIIVAWPGEAAAVSADAGAGAASSSGLAASGSGASSAAAGASGSSSGLVNINTATVEELQALSGVGPSTAQAIVDERESAGAFASIEDVMRVSGIGEKKFDKIKDHICV